MQHSLTDKRARFVYEAARLHAIALKCPVVPDQWETRNEPFRQQFKQLIEDLYENKRNFRDPKEAHDSWVKSYLQMGWKYGKRYDPEKKLHPDLVPYEELDPKEKVKDEVFLALVEVAKKHIW